MGRWWLDAKNVEPSLEGFLQALLGCKPEEFFNLIGITPSRVSDDD